MSLFSGIGNGLKFNAASNSEPINPNSNSMFSGMFSRPIAGVPVDKETALTYGAVWRCVSMISEHLAMMPSRVFESNGDSRVIASDHPVDHLLYRQANEETNSYDFKQAIFAAALLEGNGIAEIEQLRNGEAAALWQLEWERVEMGRMQNGKLIYEIDNQRGANTYLRPDQVLHIKGFSRNGLTGLSVVSFAKQAISMGLAIEHFGAAFFGNGAMPGGVIEWGENATMPEGWGADAAKNLKKSWNKNHRGAGRNSGIEILEPGQKFKTVGIAPNEAQFLESRKFSKTEIAGWFGVPPHKLGDLERATNANIEMQNIEYVTDCLHRWAIRFEQEVNSKLLKGNYYNKFSFNSLIRGDLKTRQEFYKTMLDRGIYSINEVRALEDMNPVDGGDLRLVQMNMTDLRRAKEQGNTAQKRGTDNV